LEERLGVRPVFGGFHSAFGTKNALIALDKGRYLEILAADDSNTEVPKPRWMGIDVLRKNQLTRWALTSDQLKADSLILKQINPKMGRIRGGSRNVANAGLLQWQLIMPLPRPEVAILPFMVDWSTSAMHPTDTMPNSGCRLVKLYGTHPSPEKFKTTVEQLDIDFEIRTATEITLKAIITCPKGRIEI